MDVRKKLVELINYARDSRTGQELAERIADYLLANGVTVQEWIPISEPPKKDGRYLVYDCDSGNYYDSYYDETVGEFGEWQSCFDPHTLGAIDCEWNSYPNITHWQYLPQPPKGE